MLTGVRMELEGSTLALLATDRYRAAIREIAWRPNEDGMSLQALMAVLGHVTPEMTLRYATLASPALRSGSGCLGVSGKRLAGGFGTGRLATRSRSADVERTGGIVRLEARLEYFAFYSPCQVHFRFLFVS